MSKHRGPTEAGSGGKLGLRSMDHRSYNSEIKQAARKKRRLQDQPLDEECDLANTDNEEKTNAR